MDALCNTAATVGDSNMITTVENMEEGVSARLF
jgi:hypothetical protein